MAQLLLNGTITETDYRTLSRAKENSQVLKDLELEVAELAEGQVAPPQATILSFGAYKGPETSARIVTSPTFAQLYNSCNTYSSLIVSLELAVQQPTWPEPEMVMVTNLVEMNEIPQGEYYYYVDIETKGDLDTHRPSWEQIISLAICVEGTSYVMAEEFVQRHKGEIQALLHKHHVIMFNGKFDSKYLEVAYNEDVMLKYYALFPNASTYSLEGLSEYLLGMEDWSSTNKRHLGKLRATDKKALEEAEGDTLPLGDGAYLQKGVEYTASNGYERIPRKELYWYNAIDVYTTWLLDKVIHTRWLCNDNRAMNVYKMLLDYSYMFMDIESKGIRFDYEYMCDLEESLIAQQAELEEKLNELAGREVNPRSPKQVKDLLHEVGIRVKSTGEAVLKGYAGNPIVDTILEIRGVSKQLGTYVTGYKNQLIDGYGYATFKLHASVTGRIGGGGPSALTIPRDKTIKRMVLPDEGQVIVGADLSQAELRVMACESGDEELIHAFDEDAGDFFDNLLVQAYEDFNPDRPDYEDVRARMKGVVYGASFARGVKAIAESLEISMDEAQELMNLFIVPGSDFHKWRREIERKAKHAKPIDTRYGRRYVNESVQIYTAQNISRSGLSFTSQATANDICLQTARTLWISGVLDELDARIMTTLHDAIYISCPPEHAEWIGNHLQELYQVVGSQIYPDHSVPFASDVEVGENMGDMVSLEEWLDNR